MARRYRKYRSHHRGGSSSQHKYPKRSYARRSYRRRKATPIPLPIFIAVGLLLVVMAAFVQLGYSPDLGVMVLFGVLAVVAVVTLSLAGFFGWRQYQKLKAFSVSDIDNMDGIEFEHYLQKLLNAVGYDNVSVTQGSGDFGADLIASKDGVKYAVQAKRYQNNVGVEAVYQVMGGKAYYKCQEMMVVTNSKYTKAAWELARESGCYLVDRGQLQDWVLQFQQSK